MKYLIAAFIVSLLVTLAVVRMAHVHQHWSGDHDTDGPQKFHVESVPRVGGVALLAALMAIVALLAFNHKQDDALQTGLLLLAALPVFLGGLAEDLTKRIRPSIRLALAALSALLGGVLLGALLVRADLPWLDIVLQVTPIVWLVTVLAVSGAVNAINIIDGFNGLVGGFSLLVFGALAWVALVVGDIALLHINLAMMGAIVGFMVWNFPMGLIFLGDGGAYLIGFVMAESSLLLVGRHPKVSAWFPMLLLIYPVFETLFSIYRKAVVRGGSPAVPDGVHLHMLIYRRLVRWVGIEEGRAFARNAATSPYLWLLSSLAVFPAVVFWDQTSVLLVFVLLFSITYVWLYRSIVRFRVPRWGVKKRRNGP